MTPTHQEIAEIAGKLPKRAVRAISRMGEDWIEEGGDGPARKDAYSLWWGRAPKGLIEKPRAVYSGHAVNWCYRLTPLGLSVRAFLLNRDSDREG